MPKCHHHRHDHDHCMEPRHCEPQEQMPMDRPSGGCGAPPSIPIHGRCVMTPQGPICCVAMPHHRMR